MMTLTFPEFKYVSFQELCDAMEWHKGEAFNRIPGDLRDKAKFLGYQIECDGDLKALIKTKCGFNIPHRQEITRDFHREAMNHLFEHKDHHLTIHVDYDVEG